MSVCSKNEINGFLKCLFVFVYTAIVLPISTGQVDPDWLKSWNKGLEQQPLVITSQSRIASKEEPGLPMVVHGQLFLPKGGEATDVVVQAYHRNDEGFEFGSKENSLSTWELQGWAKTDEDGRFEFRTIRPAADHLGTEAAHIHFTLVSEEFGKQWVRSFFLADDPLVTVAQRLRSNSAGDFGRVRAVEKIEGVQHITVKIKLKEKADF